MMDKELFQRIQLRAWEIYEWRKENNIAGCALGDWLDAEAEVITDRRLNRTCPVCNFLLARRNNIIFCLRSNCNWQIESKRKQDGEIADFNDIKREYNGG